jgi:hypothetical protein
MARIYEPRGAGPFPVVLDLHGGAWQRKDRKAEEPMDRAIASSGVLVVAVDLTLSGEAPYPAAVQDASYGVRWLKARAAEWNGDPSTLGLRQLERRPRRRADRHAPERPALQRDPVGQRAERRHARCLCRHALATATVRALAAGRAEEEENLIKASKTSSSPGSDPRGEPAGDA